jgi:hypothetical protein
MNYNTSFICTYIAVDDIEEADALYRSQFLQAFNLTEWNQDKVSKEMEDLYKIMMQCDWLMEEMRRLLVTQPLLAYVRKDDMLFTLLFQFDIFWATHRCICDYNKNNCITDKSKQYLKNVIDKKTK